MDFHGLQEHARDSCLSLDLWPCRDGTRPTRLSVSYLRLLSRRVSLTPLLAAPTARPSHPCQPTTAPVWGEGGAGGGRLAASGLSRRVGPCGPVAVGRPVPASRGGSSTRGRESRTAGGEEGRPVPGGRAGPRRGGQARPEQAGHAAAAPAAAHNSHNSRPVSAVAGLAAGAACAYI